MVVLVGVTSHHGARESRVQGEAPKSGGGCSRQLNRMVIWGEAPGDAGESGTNRSPLGVSCGMVKVISPVLTGSMGKRAWYQAPRPVLTQPNPNDQRCNGTLVGTTSRLRRHHEPRVPLSLVVLLARWAIPSEGIEGHEWGT